MKENNLNKCHSVFKFICIYIKYKVNNFVLSYEVKVIYFTGL